ncbi:MAG: phosphoribosylformylglycinamidine synthase subunit PurQ, partial [Christensenellales bacterium]
AGAQFEDVYLTLQEYFAKPGRDARRWGQPLSALLGALRAQRELGVAAIGGKDSMSGTFEQLDVPPTLVSFAVTTEDIGHISSNEFKGAGHRVALIAPEYAADGLPDAQSLLSTYERVTALLRSGEVIAAHAPGYGGCAEAIFKMAIGNRIGFSFTCKLETLFSYRYGGFVVEFAGAGDEGITLGYTTDCGTFTRAGAGVSLDRLLDIYENKLEPVFSCNIPTVGEAIDAYRYEARDWSAPAVKIARPRVLIPVFPGTNCEYESAKAVEAAGARADIMVINNRSSEGVARSIERFADAIDAAQAIFIPGGFSGGDEPDGSAKLITAFFRNDAIRAAVARLMDERGGLMLGICNGFQALIKLGLVPFGKIIDADADVPTIAPNIIGRHQSRLVHTRVASNLSPWLKRMRVGDIRTMPISHGEGRLVAREDLIAQLAASGQIATQYVDLHGEPTDDIRYNPNGSAHAIEGITSPDGRVLGKMGHAERIGAGLYKNVPGESDLRLFEAMVQYFR